MILLQEECVCLDFYSVSSILLLLGHVYSGRQAVKIEMTGAAVAKENSFPLWCCNIKQQLLSLVTLLLRYHFCLAGLYITEEVEGKKSSGMTFLELRNFFRGEKNYCCFGTFWR